MKLSKKYANYPKQILTHFHDAKHYYLRTKLCVIKIRFPHSSPSVFLYDCQFFWNYDKRNLTFHHTTFHASISLVKKSSHKPMPIRNKRALFRPNTKILNPRRNGKKDLYLKSRSHSTVITIPPAAKVSIHGRNAELVDMYAHNETYSSLYASNLAGDKSIGARHVAWCWDKTRAI